MFFMPAPLLFAVLADVCAGIENPLSQLPSSQSGGQRVPSSSNSASPASGQNPDQTAQQEANNSIPEKNELRPFCRVEMTSELAGRRDWFFAIYYFN